mmetsp:Transcript_8445/g.24192  ORF Transcript_8445/g.24192 Transcript_8445/m.24192 type:complete len:273 (-) Transcript_8445:53-871(-)
MGPWRVASTVEPRPADVGQHPHWHQAVNGAQGVGLGGAGIAVRWIQALAKLGRRQVPLDESHASLHGQPLEPRSEPFQPRRVPWARRHLVPRPLHDQEIELLQELVARHDEFFVKRVPGLPCRVLGLPCRDVCALLQPIGADDEDEIDLGMGFPQAAEEVICEHRLRLEALDVAYLDRKAWRKCGIDRDLAHHVPVYRRRLQLGLVRALAARHEPNLVCFPTVDDLGSACQVGVRNGVVGAAINRHSSTGLASEPLIAYSVSSHAERRQPFE